MALLLRFACTPKFSGRPGGPKERQQSRVSSFTHASAAGKRVQDRRRIPAPSSRTGPSSAPGPIPGPTPAHPEYFRLLNDGVLAAVPVRSVQPPTVSTLPRLTAEVELRVRHRHEHNAHVAYTPCYTASPKGIQRVALHGPTAGWLLSRCGHEQMCRFQAARMAGGLDG